MASTDQRGAAAQDAALASGLPPSPGASPSSEGSSAAAAATGGEPAAHDGAESDGSATYGPGNRRRGFIATACQFCLQTEALVHIQLKVCSKCKAVAYCCVDHQRADWAYHKRICRAFQSILDLTLYPQLSAQCTAEDWWNSRHAGLKAVEVLLSMMGTIQLSSVEREMVIFSRHCELCFNTAREKLFACDACYMVSYCCEEHQQEHQAEHSKYCHRYLFAHRCLQALRRYDMPPVWFSPLVCQAYQPLPFDWRSYLSIRAAPTMPGPEMALVCDVLSLPLTLLYAMERLLFVEDGKLKPLNHMEHLVIHLLDCERHQEYLAMTKYEELLHYLPNLRSLTVVLIGSALNCSPDMIATEEIACDDCLHSGRRISLAAYSGAYMAFLEAWRDDYPGGKIPTLAAWFNGKVLARRSRVTETQDAQLVPERDQALNYLLCQGIPTLVTARHRRDIELCDNLLLGRHARANPYAGLVPHRVEDPTQAGGEPLDHVNQHFLVFAGTQELHLNGELSHAIASGVTKPAPSAGAAPVPPHAVAVENGARAGPTAASDTLAAAATATEPGGAVESASISPDDPALRPAPAEDLDAMSTHIVIK